MNITYDEPKRKSNLSKHGFDFADAKAVFEGVTFTIIDNRFDYGEERYITMGLLETTVVVLVHTERKDSIRIISMRKATKSEQKIYSKRFANRLGTY